MSGSRFDEIAHAYDHSLPAHVVEHYLRKRTGFIVEHCPPGSALDVGCGTGALAARLDEAGYETVGIDPSEGMLRELRQRAPRIRAVQGSGTELPFANDEFDLVLSVAVMHHIADADAVRRTLGEMVRVTRPGGLVLVWDHNPRNPYWKLLMARVPQDSGDERLVPPAELIAGLRAAGAEPRRLARLGMVPDFTPPSLLSAAEWIEAAVERVWGLRSLCAHNVVLAQKL